MNNSIIIRIFTHLLAKLHNSTTSGTTTYNVAGRSSHPRVRHSGHSRALLFHGSSRITLAEHCTFAAGANQCARRRHGVSVFESLCENKDEYMGQTLAFADLDLSSVCSIVALFVCVSLCDPHSE